MGNSQDKTESVTEKDLSATTDYVGEKLTATFQVAANDENLLTHDAFQKLFHPVGELGNILFQNYFLESEQTSNSLDKTCFIKKGKTLIETLSVSGDHELDFYIHLFSRKSKEFNKKDALLLLEICHATSFVLLGRSTFKLQESLTKAMLQSAFGQEETLSSSDFQYWCSRHNHRLFHPLLSSICASLLRTTQTPRAEGGDTLAMPQSFMCEKNILTCSNLWALCNHLPLQYARSGGVAALDSTTPLANVLISGWHLLYDGNAQGLSYNRFKHHVFNYKAPTVLLMYFNDCTFCVGIEEEWREKTDRWGGSECFVAQVTPQFKFIQSGANMIYLNMEDRRYPKGLQIGKDVKTTFLQVNEDFTKVKYYGIDQTLHLIEVWGCGSAATQAEQTKQQKWEHGQAEKHKNYKLKVDDWKDSPDRQLLQLGGVEIDHAKRGDT